MKKRWLPLLALALAPCASAALIETVQSGHSEIRIEGATVASQSDAKTDGRVSVYAIWGTSSTPEVRTAARSSVTGELAANVRMDDKNRYSFTTVDETISAATLEVHVAPDSVFLRRAELTFFLPPSLLEVTSNAELPDNALEMLIFANLRVCFATICGGGEQFSFQSILTASWRNYSNSIIATGNPALDLTPLRNPTVTDIGGPGVDFERTTTIDFDAFSGHVDLGLIPPGSPLTVEYQFQARGSGELVTNLGLAALNDPFLLDTDPVQPGPALTLTLLPVPEPATWLLLLGGLAAAASRRRRI